MKNSSLFVITLASALALVGGCKVPQARVTHIPEGTPVRESTGNSADLNTTPTTASKPSDGVTGGALTDTSLADDSSLEGREFDRTAFAQETVFFEYDQVTIKASEASKLEQVAGAFKAKGPGYDLLIEGHCDERGTEEYNRSLGERRALAIRELLMKSGLDSQHVFTRSFGKDKPAVAEHNDGAWSKNRRGEFILVLPRKITTTQNPQ